MNQRAQHQRTHGAFSLVEVVISIAIMGVLMVASLNAVAYAARDRRYTNEASLGKSLATELAREIMSQRYADPTGSAVVPSGATSRTAFNDVADYSSFVESPPKARDGTLIPNATGWTRGVRVQRAVLDTATNEVKPSAVATDPLLAFTVVARSPKGKTYSVTGFRSAYGPFDISTPDAGLYTALHVQLQTATQSASSSTDLPNVPTP